MCKTVYRKYELTKELFLKEIDGNKECTAITNGKIQDFYSVLKKKYDITTTFGYMTKLKTFIRFAIDNDRIKINPFQGIKIVKGQKDISFLSESELMAIKDFKLDNESLERVRDMFLVMAGTGLSYSDLRDLNKTDIKQNENGVYFINKNRNKTGVDYVSVVFPWAKEIIDKYETLPVISNQKLNCYLHHIEKLMSLKKSLHCHLARHTYATLLLNKGVRLETVSKTLGHTTTKITQQYYAKFQPTTIVNEVAKIFN